MIALIDYEAGNVASVRNALARLGTASIITNKPDDLDRADAVIFPGVGHAAPAMARLRESGLDQWIKNTRKPLLGICLGMQLLFESTEEGDTDCLGILPGRLKKFDAGGLKVPHMGWNNVSPVAPDPLFTDIETAHFYFVHSYYAPVNSCTTAACTYGTPFAAAVRQGPVAGVQFHPEKSGQDGARLLQAFLTSAGV